VHGIMQIPEIAYHPRLVMNAANFKKASADALNACTQTHLWKSAMMGMPFAQGVTV
jgi:hypothetical protein